MTLELSSAELHKSSSGSLARRLRAVWGHPVATPAFGGLCACALVLGLTSSFVLPFLSLWGTREIGMTPLSFACFMTSNALCAIAASTWLARLSDTRWSRRSVLAIGATGGALGHLGYALIADPVLLFLVGATVMSVSSVSFAQIFAHAREELARRNVASAPFALGVLRATFSLAWTVGPALGALVVERFGYRGSFLTAAALLLVYLALVLAFVPGRLPRALVSSDRGKPLRQLLVRPLLLANFAAFVLLFAAVSMNLLNLPLFITRELGGSQRQVGIAFAIAPCFEVPLMLWLGRVAASGRLAFIIQSGALVGLAYFLGLGAASAPWHVYPAQVLNAFAIAVTMSVAIPYFQDLLPGQSGLSTQVYSSSWGVGSLLGYFSFGLLADSLGHRGLTLVCATLAALAVIVLLSIGSRTPAVTPP